ncbi:MAG: DNA translocase FtsK [Armatimonadetes bacterium]|nr:DNA translocase FtsK [Armatimonadota bacterium]
MRPKKQRIRKKSAPSREPGFRRVRIFLGLVLLLLVFPFVGLAVGWPGLSGSLGRWVSAVLVEGLGKGALLVPFAALAWSLHLLDSPIARHLRIPLAGAILFLDLVLLAERMGHQGGGLGQLLDGTLIGLIGPGGAWIVALTGLVVGLAAVCKITLHEIFETVSTLAGWGWELLRTGRRFCVGVVEALTPEDEHPAAAGEMTIVQPAPLASKLPPVPSTPAPSPAFSTPPVPDEPASWEELAGIEDALPLDSAELEDDVPASEDGEAGELEDEELDSREELEEDWPSAPPAADPAPKGPPALKHLEPAGPRGNPRTPPTRQSRVVEEGVMEDPCGQLRLFPGPAPAPAVRYKLPPLTLLDDKPVVIRTRPPEDKSQILLDALESFGVQARLLQIVRGPTVTRYELQPARGVKVNRFTSLTNDMALALASTSVRIEAPIPGKSAIGIEIPNEQNEMVVLKEILNTPVFKKTSGLAMGLGKDQAGYPVLANLQKMPHLLVAGTTGSGKSVCVNCLILSLLYRFTPRQLQLMMVDPKQVELSIYQGIPHLVAFSDAPEGEIIVDPKRAAMALHQVVELMESRYKLFAETKVRNLEEYNLKAAEPLPWFVVIIDELADLMMVASKAVETSICRLAQKARASGIHMILATQRPSADVITGLIKVNIPSRVAFAVSSQVDSRVILDTGGAEHLLGKGDMLFLPVDASDPRRLQGAFLSNEEIQRVVEFWKAQACPENLIQLDVDGAPSLEGLGEDGDDGDDDLCDEALQVVVRRQQASASLLQTELKVGYARARRILNLLEKKGYVGPADGSKPRKILYGGGGE